ncbi:hypothetical protein Trydic_g17659 [Trypoxylus dichotomus]
MDRTCDQLGGSEKNGEGRGDPPGSDKTEIAVSRPHHGPKYEILQLIIRGKIMGKRSIERRRISWFRNLRKPVNLISRYLTYLRPQIPKLR